MDDRFVVVGLTNGSITCIYSFNNVIKWTISVSNVSITAVLADLYDKADEQHFYAADANGNIFAIDEKGNVITKIKTKAARIFAILGSDPTKIVAYYIGGAYEYKLQGSNLILIKEYTSTGRYSVDADGTFHNTREKV